LAVSGRWRGLSLVKVGEAEPVALQAWRQDPSASLLHALFAPLAGHGPAVDAVARSILK